MTIATCPDDRLLADYLAGGVSIAAIDAISEHIDTCLHCLERLEHVAEPRPLGELTPRVNDATFESAVARLLNTSYEPVGPGTVLRDYRLVEKIGEGGMGSVFKAVHERLQKIVAVKVIRQGPWADGAALARFEREMKAVGRLRDPHIVQATDAGEVNGVPFLVMEYVEGMNLSRHVKTYGPLAAERAIELIRQAAMGLQHAHDAGLIHRDIKPGNLMLTPDGRVKILDLGLAVIAEDEAPPLTTGEGSTNRGSDLTSASRAVGTFDYMAPEQKQNAHAVDARADIYGLGGTLWYLLTASQARDMANPPMALPRVVWNRLLAEAPADRFATAGEVALVLASKRRLRTPIVAAAAAIFSAVTAAIVLSQPAPAGGVPVPLSPPTPITVPKIETLPPGGTIPLTGEQAQQLQKQWATALKQQPLDTDRFGTKYALIPPGGPFAITPKATAALTKPYYLGVTEVTVAEFARFAASRRPMYQSTVEISGKGQLWFGDPDKPNRQKSDAAYTWKNPGYLHQPDFPVTYVSNEDARAYCEWLSALTKDRYRLPTEAEWLWAYRAGSGTQYYTGDEFTSLDDYEWVKMNSGMTPHAVGLKLPNAWGLHDMHGNVSEWTGEYTTRSERAAGHLIDPKGPPKANDVLTCGGSYVTVVDTRVEGITLGRLTFFYSPRVGMSKLGFRVLREVDIPESRE